MYICPPFFFGFHVEEIISEISDGVKETNRREP